MATQRMVNTRFWNDGYISNLDPIEKLMFMYFLTNACTNICGIYEISLKQISFDTGIDKEMVIKIIDRFTKDSKIMYSNGWLGIKNFTKHQNTKNVKISKGIEESLRAIPKDFLAKFNSWADESSRLMMTHDDSSHIIKYNIIESNVIKAEPMSHRSTDEVSEDSSDSGKKYSTSDIIDEFKITNSINYKDLFKRKTEHEASKKILERFTPLDVRFMLTALFEAQRSGIEFVPSVSSPTEFLRKGSKVRDFIEKIGKEKKTIKKYKL